MDYEGIFTRHGSATLQKPLKRRVSRRRGARKCVLGKEKPASEQMQPEMCPDFETGLRLLPRYLEDVPICGDTVNWTLLPPQVTSLFLCPIFSTSPFI